MADAWWAARAREAARAPERSPAAPWWAVRATAGSGRGTGVVAGGAGGAVVRTGGGGAGTVEGGGGWGVVGRGGGVVGRGGGGGVGVGEQAPGPMTDTEVFDPSGPVVA